MGEGGWGMGDGIHEIHEITGGSKVERKGQKERDEERARERKEESRRGGREI